MKNPLSNYLDLNKSAWNNKVAAHLQSEFYDLEGFKAGANSLNAIELGLFGDVKGKKILHLQCHFGQDSLSLARMGAEVTAMDLSDEAIAEAQKLAKTLHLDATFICCDLYDLPKHLDDRFDIVFTSYGTIGWLPDLTKWAKIISHFLKPDGILVFVEFHPFIWMYDNDFKEITYSYFKSEAIIETEKGTYADMDADIEQTMITWNHSLSEVMGSLIGENLVISHFEEYDYSPYNCFKNCIAIAPKKYQIETFGPNVPLVYSIVATKKNQ